MKNRTRLFFGVAVGVLVLGLGTGLLASYVGQNFTIIGGNGPDALAYVPADARMVAFADIRDLANSELRQKMRQFEPSADARNKFEAETGIDVERDVYEIVAASWPQGAGPQSPPLILARGRFDTDAIQTLVVQHGGTVENYKGKQLLVIADSSHTVAVSFVEDDLVAAGDAAAVRQAIDTKLSGTNSVTGNAEVMKQIKDVNDGNAWAVAKFDSLAAGPFPTAALPKELAQQLPPINWVAFSGHIDSGVRATVRVEAKDDKSAEDLRQVVRGFMALARLQAGQRVEFAELVNSLELGGQGTTITLGFSLPGSLIDTLGHIAQQRRQAPTAPAVPDAPAAPVPSL
jgi:hypothetical protein